MGSMSDQIIVGVPGLWPDRSAFLHGLIASDTGFIFAGMLMMDVETKESVQVDLYDHDPDLVRSFAIAGGGQLSDETLTSIAAHTFTVYLIVDGRSRDNVALIARAAAAVCATGGLGVKVETAGVAFSAETWSELHPYDPTRLFTVVLSGDEPFSCGMRNFGLPDSQVHGVLSQEATELLTVFNRYQVDESPVLVEGQTFSVGVDAPLFRLHREPYPDEYSGDEGFWNPDGLWVLRLAE
jgi:hypothetical protein